MTLASGYAPEIKNGNDSTTSFSFGFVVNKAADIQVTHSVAVGDGTFTDTVLTEGTGTSNYSVSSIVYPNSGSITYPALLGTELATGDKLTIARVVDLDQETNLRNQGKYKPEQVEAMGDYDRMVDQQQQDEIDRSLKVPISDDSGANYTLPVPVAEKIFRWNAAGTALELVSLSDLSLGLGTSFKWNFDSSIVMADPGTGDVRFDNATIASVTNLAFSNVSAQSGNPDVSDFVAALGASDSTVKGHIAVWKDGSAANYAIFSIDAAVTDNTSWLQASVVHIQSGGSFNASDSLVFMFARTGDKGDTGATGATGAAGVNATLDYQFESATTDADQGAGKLWLNHATVSSATVLYLDDDDDNGNDVSAFTSQWDDAADATGIRGTVFFKSKANPSADYAVFNITGATTDATAYQKFTITNVMSFGTFSDAEELIVEFIQGAGDTSIGKHSLYIDGGFMRPTVTSGSPAMADAETTAGRPDISSRNLDGSVDEALGFKFAMPKSWDAGTITFKVHWSTLHTGTNGIAIGLEAVSVADGSTIDVAFGTAVVVTDDAQSNAEDHLETAESSALTVASAAKGAMTYFRLYRDVSDANDDMTEDCQIEGITLYFTTDTGTDA